MCVCAFSFFLGGVYYISRVCTCVAIWAFLDTLNCRCRIILVTPKGTIILTTTQIFFLLMEIIKGIILSLIRTPPPKKKMQIFFPIRVVRGLLFLFCVWGGS